MSKPFNPKTTTFTNEMLDIIMPSVPPNAWKILCFAMRKTAGWQDLSTASGRKESDIISLSQFMKGCGIDSENTVMSAIEFCINAGYLLRFSEGQGRAYRYRLNTEYELQTSAEIAEVDLTTSAKIEEVNLDTSSKIEEVTSSKIEETNNKTINTKRHLTSEEYKQMTKDSLERGLRNHNFKDDRVNEYPEDVREVIKSVCALFNLECPSIKSSHAGQWIKESRELSDACGEFGTVVLEEISKDFKKHMRNNGEAPFSVGAPRALITTARAKAGTLRTMKVEEEKPYIPHASEVWMGGVCYINGVPV